MGCTVKNDGRDKKKLSLEDHVSADNGHMRAVPILPVPISPMVLSNMLNPTNHFILYLRSYPGAS